MIVTFNLSLKIVKVRSKLGKIGTNFFWGKMAS